MEAPSTTLLVLAYLLAVADGAMAEKGTLLSPPGRTGLGGFMRQHPWMVAGAAPRHPRPRGSLVTTSHRGAKLRASRSHQAGPLGAQQGC
jgi:hypothetical protein